MVVRLHPEALTEYAEAVGFYEERAPGLGREFFEEVQRVLHLVSEHPGLGSPFADPYRRAYCRRFPFGVIYAAAGAFAPLPSASLRDMPSARQAT